MHSILYAGMLSKKRYIGAWIGQSHSTIWPVLPNVIGQFGQLTWNLQYRCGIVQRDVNYCTIQNKNRIGHWPDYFSTPHLKNCLGVHETNQLLVEGPQPQVWKRRTSVFSVSFVYWDLGNQVFSRLWLRELLQRRSKISQSCSCWSALMSILKSIKKSESASNRSAG